jgi:hypothetical protein
MADTGCASRTKFGLTLTQIHDTRTAVAVESDDDMSYKSEGFGKVLAGYGIVRPSLPPICGRPSNGGL